jgi:hypothetical protein
MVYKDIRQPNGVQPPKSPVQKAQPGMSHQEIEALALDVLTYGPLLDQIRDSPRQGKIIASLVPEKAPDGRKLSGEDRVKLFVQAAQQNPQGMAQRQQKLIASIQPDERRQEYQGEMDDLNRTLNRSFDTELPVSPPVFHPKEKSPQPPAADTPTQKPTTAKPQTK